MCALPLDGYTVIDLGGSVATATCGRLFADFGARVINVEPPGGHATRRLPPLAAGEEGSGSGLYALLSPNKESVVAGDAASALRCVESADVVLRCGPRTFRSIASVRRRPMPSSVSWSATRSSARSRSRPLRSRHPPGSPPFNEGAEYARR